MRASLLGAPLACLLAAMPLAAEITVHAYPPAYCAAFWQGYADVLGDDGERALADRFRDASVRLIGEAETDAIIEERRPWIRDLMDAYIYAQDDQSRKLFERLVTDCGRLEADLPYLRP
ncbi:hypothetical protein FHG66_01225 [Rubellimicrobium rubrum]|uniref:Uncharacterized protein n=1 Tax=Rubellimicrobium rubrum TaxID=2585369 RepID=A0A5C4N5G5_9RHOB|nr:hypothetical protein [Rubellimicrobium rubrum]TNC52943.1 hypothetical protein FHG66_01225 [Rubellimicrobium rubrum]